MLYPRPDQTSSGGILTYQRMVANHLTTAFQFADSLHATVNSCEDSYITTCYETRLNHESLGLCFGSSLEKSCGMAFFTVDVVVLLSFRNNAAKENLTSRMHNVHIL